LPQEGYLERISDAERRGLQQALAWSVVGDVGQVGRWLKEFVALTKADELIIDARIHDPAARCRSYQLAAQSMSA
jgi:alkanesulfonate monooxygenase SsuD/methylene tetrahydromethanopterin reductase-like flavin-dependent oxidoreductase (luciferase family)